MGAEFQMHSKQNLGDLLQAHRVDAKKLKATNNYLQQALRKESTQNASLHDKLSGTLENPQLKQQITTLETHQETLRKVTLYEHIT